MGRGDANRRQLAHAQPADEGHAVAAHERGHLAARAVAVGLVDIEGERLVSQGV
jgi:hypothetical protein